MKEVVVRNTEEKLNIEQKDGYTIYKCSYCENELIEINGNNEWRFMSSCPHFQWEEMTISCYIGIGDECNPQEIKQLRFKSIIQIFDDIWVNLLVPK